MSFTPLKPKTEILPELLRTNAQRRELLNKEMRLETE